jgi:hypothetical protein
MMGSNDKSQDELFYAFNLDEIVPQHHLLRDIDRLLAFNDVRKHLAPYYSHTGRPSVDPELMIRMLLIGYCCGIRSERQPSDQRVPGRADRRRFIDPGGEEGIPERSAGTLDLRTGWSGVLHQLPGGSSIAHAKPTVSVVR